MKDLSDIFFANCKTLSSAVKILTIKISRIFASASYDEKLVTLMRLNSVSESFESLIDVKPV